MTFSIKYSDKKNFEKWFDSLPADVAGAVLEKLRRLESGQKNLLKSLGDGLYELRIFQRPGYRIYGTFASSTFVIIGYGTKDSQKRDIRRAKRQIDARRTSGRSPP